MANDSTAEAALITSKIDMKSDTRGLNWQQVTKIVQTNPRTKYIWVHSPGITLEVRTDKVPFSDIRVRQALQMAIDRKAIAGSIYGGSTDGTPCGLVSPTYYKYCYPYDMWSDELKQAYGYDAARARRLLEEAGYADGFGITCLIDSQDNMELLQILKYEFNEIGVTLGYKMMDSAALMGVLLAGKQEQVVLEYRIGMTGEPYTSLSVRLSDSRANYTHNADPEYDTLVKSLEAAANQEDAQKFAAAADKYALEQCWSINICPLSTSILWQSYVKGYSGENLVPYTGFYFARCWVEGK
jgi:ABC-type transport system substrate-binding protein